MPAMPQLTNAPSAIRGVEAIRASRSVSAPAPREGLRPTVRGKFLFVGDEKLYVRGVTYGTFRPGANGVDLPDIEVVERDLAQMAANGVNAIRTYTVPPRWVLDAAQRNGLYVMVGLPWEQHVTFLDDRERAGDIERRVRAGVRACAGHPAVLAYAIGNEIPASIVRWHGARRVERYLERLYQAAKAEDPGGLVTYVSYPSTEYLDLPFIDFVCFNVYLESQERLAAYQERLQTLTGDRPLVMGEIGLDSRRHGHEAQAHALRSQLRTTFAAGCAGAFVFAWTDEWHRGGYDVEDWDFGLTGRQRQPKPALAAVREAFAEAPFPPDIDWPSITVVVCSFNGERTIRDCLEGLRKLDYPDFDVIVIDDGSTDATATIAHEYGFRVISTENRGLSSARNTGLRAARGEIIAYTDDDASPDPHWLRYLAATFVTTAYAGVGGPNLPPPGDGWVADCVANAPGGPIHVLLSDREAEHIPGCNMAFRRTCLEAIGGFDPRFRAAGDDVDVCWRLQERGWKLGFNAAAVVWHHRRDSVRAYWRQQLGYGKAEALLERKWPQKYNRAGYVTWAGRLYGKGVAAPIGWGRERIFQGTWGSAPFQSLYQPTPAPYWSLTLLPEWYLVVVALTGIAAIGTLWPPLFNTLPLLVLSVGAPVVQAGVGAARAVFSQAPRSRIAQLKLRGLTAVLHLLQPLARLCGRLRHGLAPWRWRGVRGIAWPWPRISTLWSEQWQMPQDRLHTLESSLRKAEAYVRRGGDFDRWDLEVQGGLLGMVRLRMAVEEHSGGKQMVRVGTAPRYSPLGIAIAVALVGLSIQAALDSATGAAVILGMATTLLGLRTVHESSAAMAAILDALSAAHPPELGRAPHARRDGRELGMVEANVAGQSPRPESSLRPTVARASSEPNGPALRRPSVDDPVLVEGRVAERMRGRRP